MKIERGIVTLGIGILFIIFLVGLSSAISWNTSFQSCFNINVTGGTENLTNFPFYINLTWKNGMSTNFSDIRFVNTTCNNGGSQLNYEIDSINTNYTAGFWVNASLATGNNTFSVYYNNSTVGPNENAFAIWNDYLGVWHFGEGTNITVRNSASIKYNLTGSSNTTIGNVSFRWSNATLGYAMNISTDICGYTSENLTEIYNNTNRSVFVFAQKQGNSTTADLHGDIFHLGFPQPDQRWSIRTHNTPVGINGQNWSIDANSVIFKTNNLSSEFGYNMHYVESITSNYSVNAGNTTTTWILNNSILKTGGFNISTLKAPIALGCTWWSGFSGSLLTKFNGTIDEARLSNQSFSSAYINRTYSNLDPTFITVGGDVPFDTTNPQVNFSQMVPPNLNYSYPFNRTTILIYNVTDETAISASTVQLYHKSNTTLSDTWRYVNGTSFSNYLNTSVNQVNGTFFWNWTLAPDDIFPGSHNLQPLILHNTAHSNLSIATNLDAVKSRFYNISNTTQNNYIAFMVENASATAAVLDVYYCNSTYVTGDFNAINQCSKIYMLNNTFGMFYNVTVNSSSYHVRNFTMLNGQIGSVVVTANSTFVFASDVVLDTWNVKKIDVSTTSETTQTSANQGTTWANSATTVDMMIFQFDNSTFFNYVCANDTSNNQNCSAVSSEVIESSVPEPACPATMLGNNTITNPCKITTCDELQNMSLGLSKFYSIENNLDCTNTTTWDGGAGFHPVGDTFSVNFNGSIDGKNYTITNIYITNRSLLYTGIFGITTTLANISNINIINATVLGGNSFTGALVGQLGGFVINSSVTNSSIVGRSATGGLVGVNKYLVYNSYSKNTRVNGTSKVGGLIGNHESGSQTISSYAQNVIVNGSSRVGGLAGDGIDSYIGNSYSTGNVTGNSSVGGLIGYTDAALIGSDIAVNYSFTTARIISNDLNTTRGLVGNSVNGNNFTNSYWYDWQDDNATICHQGGNTGCTILNASNTSINYFYNVSNQPMVAWEYPPWNNITNFRTYPILSYENFNASDTTTLGFTFAQANTLITPDHDILINASLYINSTTTIDTTSVNWNGTSYTIDDPSILLWWSFNNFSALNENDTFIQDLSGSNRHGLILNGTSGSLCMGVYPCPLFNNSGGKYNGAFRFSGENMSKPNDVSGIQYIRQQNTTNPAYTNHSFNSTFSIWIYPQVYNHVDVSDILVLNRFSRLSWTKGSNTTNYNINNVSTDIAVASSNGPFPSRAAKANEWSQVTVTEIDRNVTLYINGVWVNNKIYGGERRGTSPYAQVGADDSFVGGAFGALAFNGSIDELKVWNRTLNASEVLQNYFSTRNKFNNTYSEVYTNQTNITSVGINTFFISANTTTGFYNQSQNVSIRREQNTTINYSLSYGIVNGQFYGSNTHGQWLRNITNIDISGDGVTDATANVTWHREQWLASGQKFARWDVNLGTFYDGFRNKHAEEWLPSKLNITTNVSATLSYPYGWNIGISTPATASMNLSRSTIAHGQNYSVYMENNGTGGVTFQYQNINNTKIGLYNFSVWVNTSSKIDFNIKNASLSQSYCFLANFNSSSAWQQMSCTVNVTSATVNQGIGIVIGELATNEKMYWDDFEITVDGTPYNWWQIGNLTDRTEELTWHYNNGIKALYIMSYTPTFLARIDGDVNVNGANFPSFSGINNYTLFGEIAVDVINKTSTNGTYSSVIDVEVWNEPYGGFLLDNLSIDHINKSYEYNRIYNATRIAIKNAFPNMLVGGPSGYYLYTNMTRGFLSNFSQQMDFVSYHPYSYVYPFYFSPLTQSDNMMFHINNFTDYCRIYNANCSKQYLTEWNVGSVAIQNFSTGRNQEMTAQIAYTYSQELNSNLANNISNFLYQWSEIYNYNYSNYPDSFIKYAMLSEPQLDNQIYGAYNATKDFASVHGGGNTVTNSTSNYIFVVPTSSYQNTSKYLSVVNIENDSQNVTVIFNGLTNTTLTNNKTGATYNIVNGVANLGVFPAFDTQIFSTSDGVNTSTCNSTDVILSIWAYNGGKYIDYVGETYTPTTPINNTIGSDIWTYSGPAGRLIDGIGTSAPYTGSSTVANCNVTDIAIAMWNYPTRYATGIASGDSGLVPVNRTIGQAVWGTINQLKTIHGISSLTIPFFF
jgi:hypothetical protein